MNLTQILDASALAVLAAQAGWIGLLYRRMGRLRTALEGAGTVVGQLDEASRRLDDSAGGIVRKVRDGLAEVDSKIGTCRRLAQELTSASRHAEEVATRLDQALRQNRRLQSARAAAPPRELAEPLGLAERLAGRPPAFALAAPAEAIPPQEAAPEPAAVDRLPLSTGPLLALARPEPERLPAPLEPLFPLLALPPLAPALLAGLPLEAAAPPPFPDPTPGTAELEGVVEAELAFAGAPAPRTIRVKLD